jgi:outer membrane receptor protein involved in Fe transport
VVVSVIHQTRSLDLTAYTFDNAQTFINDRSSSGEVQWYYRSNPFYLVAGAGYLSGSEEFVGIFKQNASLRNVYLYGEVQPENLGVRFQGALSASSVDEDPFKRRKIDPKVGLIWTPTNDTTIRAAATRALNRPLIAIQTLEPTQVGGFNQFFDNADGTVDSRIGFGLDQKLSRDAHIGFEVTKAKIKVPLFLGDSVSDFDWKEHAGKGYFYWKLQRDRQRMLLPDWSAAVALQYEAKNIRHPEDLPGDDGIIRLDTQFVSIGLTLFPFEPFFAQCISTHVRQTGRLQAGPDADSFDVNERFWTTDISLNYRIPGRRGTFAVGASNVFDRDLHSFQELDKANPRFAARRIAFARLVMQF